MRIWHNLRLNSRPTNWARLAAIVLAATIMTGSAHSDIRLLVPEEDPGGPYYARIEFGLVHHTEEWAAIAFYRDPACVPPNFNLLLFFDFNVPRAFSCPLTVEGFEVWKNGPPPMDMEDVR